MTKKLIAALLMWSGLISADTPGSLEGVPRYAHIIVIVEENKDYSQILDKVSAPNIASLAEHFGNATRFYGEVHPSEAM